MEHILAVLDPDKKYVRKLTSYMDKKGELPFEILGFDSRVRLHTYLQTHKISVLLLSEEWKKEDFADMTDLLILLVDKKTDERVEPDGCGMISLCKYQSGEMICKKILNICAMSGNDTVLSSVSPVPEKRCEIIGVYSPVKRSLQTSFAFIYSRLVSAQKKTLYLNFEVFSGFQMWFQKEYRSDLMDLLYFLKDDTERFLLKMAAMTEEFGNVRYIPPACSYEDFMQVSAREWLKLITTIADYSDYEVLILDLDDRMQGLFSILELCSRVYTMTRPDGLSMAKIADYEAALKQTSKEAVLQKTVKCRFPVFKDIPQHVSELPYSQLADYIKNKLGEDFNR